MWDNSLRFGRVLGRCQGVMVRGHSDGGGCRPNVWWSVNAGQTGGGCSRSSARRFPRLRVRDAFFTSAAVQRVGARETSRRVRPLSPHCSGGRKRRWKIHGRRDVDGPDPGEGKGPDVMHAHHWGHVGAGWVNLRVCMGAAALLVPSSAVSHQNVLANRWGRRAGGAASSAVAYPA